MPAMAVSDSDAGSTQHPSSGPESHSQGRQLQHLEDKSKDTIQSSGPGSGS